MLPLILINCLGFTRSYANNIFNQVAISLNIEEGIASWPNLEFNSLSLVIAWAITEKNVCDKMKLKKLMEGPLTILGI